MLEVCQNYREVFQDYRAGEDLLEQGKYSSALEAYKIAYKKMKDQPHPLRAMLMDGIIRAFESSAKKAAEDLKSVKADKGYEYLLEVKPSITLKVLRSTPVPILG